MAILGPVPPSPVGAPPTMSAINQFLISIGKQPLQIGPNGLPIAPPAPQQPSAASGLGMSAAALAAAYAAKKFGAPAIKGALGFGPSTATGAPAAPTLLGANALVGSGDAAVGIGAGPLGADSTLAALQGSGLTTGASDLAASLPAASSAATSAAPIASTGALGTGLGLGPLAAIAGGVYLNGRGASDLLQGKNDKSIQGLLSRGAIGISTGGLSEGARALGLFNHKTTQQREQDTWNGLAGNSDAPTAAYANQYLNYLGSDQAKADASGANTFDAKKAAGTLTPQDVWGGAGIMQNIPGWLTKYNQDQRANISQQLINNNLITSSHGDQQLTDPNAANAIASAVLTKALSSPSAGYNPRPASVINANRGRK